MKHVFLSGAAGQLGSIVEKKCPETISLYAFTRSMLDLTDKSKVLAVLEKVQPEVIINCTAYTAVDQAENEQVQAFNVNAQAVQNLIDSVDKINKNIRIIHLSTDFVFSGTSAQPYLPSDIPDPDSIYGESKLLGEKYLLESKLANINIIRTSWLYSAYGRNFLTTMIKLMSEKKKLKVVNDQLGSPTYANTLVDIIWQFANEKDVSGIYHWSDKGVISWYDFAKAIYMIGREIDLLHNTVEIQPVSTKDYLASMGSSARIAKRPEYSALDCSKTEKKFGIMAFPWKQQLKQALLEIKENLISS